MHTKVRKGAGGPENFKFLRALTRARARFISVLLHSVLRLVEVGKILKNSEEYNKSDTAGDFLVI